MLKNVELKTCHLRLKSIAALTCKIWEFNLQYYSEITQNQMKSNHIFICSRKKHKQKQVKWAAKSFKCSKYLPEALHSRL